MRARPHRRILARPRPGPTVTITAAWRGCGSTAYSQLEIGDRASSGERKKIAKQVKRVVRGLGKTCKAEMPEVAPPPGGWPFPAAAQAEAATS